MTKLGLGIGLQKYPYDVAASLSGGATPSPTFATPTGAIYLGDSRFAFMGGVGVGGSTWSSTHGHGESVSGWITSHMDNVLLRAWPGGVYAVTSTTNLRQLDSMSTTSVAATGNPAGGATPAGTGLAVDLQFNVNASGDFSPVGHPANTAFFQPAVVNDINAPLHYTNETVSANEIISIVNALTGSGKNVFVGNEMPKGYTTIYNEKHTLSGNTFVATNTANFLDGDSFGLTGSVIDVGTCTVLTKTAGVPNPGEYAVNPATATYTVNAGAPPAVVSISYTYSQGVTLAYQTNLHEWLSSNFGPGNFISSLGKDFGMPGFLYNRAGVIPIDYWGAFIDPASGTNRSSKRGYQQDGIHPNQTGGLATKAVVKAAKTLAGWDSLPSKTKAVNKNNNAVSATTSGTLSYGPYVPVGPMAGYSFGSTQVRVINGTYNLVATETSPGVLTGTGFASGTINTTTGAISFTLSTNPGSGGLIIIEQDPFNMMPNPMFDIAQGTVALPAGVTGSLLPKGWTLTPDAATLTALGTSAAAGGFEMVVGYELIAGINWLTISGHGNPGVGGTNTRLGPTSSVSYLSQRFNTATPDKYRAEVMARVTSGSDGFLYGLSAPSLVSTMTSSVAFTEAYSGASLLARSAVVGGAAASQPYNGQMLSIEDPVVLHYITDLTTTKDMTLSLNTYRINIDYAAASPNSWKVKLALPTMKIRTD